MNRKNKHVPNNFFVERGKYECPHCKETKSEKHYLIESETHKGIVIKNTTTVSPDPMKKRLYKVNYYKCKSCGMEWHSDPIPSNALAIEYDTHFPPVTQEAELPKSEPINTDEIIEAEGESVDEH